MTGIMSAPTLDQDTAPPAAGRRTRMPVAGASTPGLSLCWRRS
ncbi:hypothetical protein BZL30_8092 [Mycobacterium kansasii]|uniref:Uncharacterized protein n=1 Tax=Mycobacterium kansasii TaxID=1768 RepID=A0A1V3WIG4_MYCKA|nr:hypothetical protein BZL30_8092 [Mycobacterium kansasii]